MNSDQSPSDKRTREPIFLNVGTDHELCRFPSNGAWSLRLKLSDGDVSHTRYLTEFEVKMIEAALAHPSAASSSERDGLLRVVNAAMHLSWLDPVLAEGQGMKELDAALNALSERTRMAAKDTADNLGRVAIHDAAQASPSSEPSSDAAMLEGYAASYASMDGRVLPADVAHDIRRNMIPALRSGVSHERSSDRAIWKAGIEAGRHYIAGSTFTVEQEPTVRACLALLKTLQENPLWGPPEASASATRGRDGNN